MKDVEVESKDNSKAAKGAPTPWTAVYVRHHLRAEDHQKPTLNRPGVLETESVLGASDRV